MNLCSLSDVAERLRGIWDGGVRRSLRGSWEWMNNVARCTVGGAFIAKTRGSLVGDRSRVGVVSSAYWSSRNGLRPRSVERGDGDDSQKVQSFHGGVLESRARLSIVVCKEGVRMKAWDVGERC
jgi:hypothetical protein